MFALVRLHSLVQVTWHLGPVRCGISEQGGRGAGLTWVGFTVAGSLVAVRSSVTWQVGPIRCGSQRASEEEGAGAWYSPGLCDASSSMGAVAAGFRQWWVVVVGRKACDAANNDQQPDLATGGPRAIRGRH